jgi:hypothetical protein
VLDKQPIQIRAQQENNTPDFPVVTSDGTNWLVAWGEFTGGVRGIKGVRVAPDGQVLDQPPVQLYLDDFNSYATHVDVTFGNGAYLVAWSDSPGPLRSFRRFSPSLAPLDPEPIVVATGGAQPGGRRQRQRLLPWRGTSATPFPPGLRGTRIAANGAVPTATGSTSPIISTQPLSPTCPGMAPTGSSSTTSTAAFRPGGHLPQARLTAGRGARSAGARHPIHER